MKPGFAPLCLLGIATLALAADSGIDPSRSTLTVTFRQENVPVDVPFKHFSGHINYNPATPASTQAQIEVLTASFDMGRADYNAEVANKKWLDSATYPKAMFVATGTKPGASGHLDVTGTLTLKGRVQTLLVPVTVSKAGTATAYDGALQISRKAFGIGDPEWEDVLDDAVTLKFHIIE